MLMKLTAGRVRALARHRILHLPWADLCGHLRLSLDVSQCLLHLGRQITLLKHHADSVFRYWIFSKILRLEFFQTKSIFIIRLFCLHLSRLFETLISFPLSWNATNQTDLRYINFSFLMIPLASKAYFSTNHVSKIKVWTIIICEIPPSLLPSLVNIVQNWIFQIKKVKKQTNSLLFTHF